MKAKQLCVAETVVEREGIGSEIPTRCILLIRDLRQTSLTMQINGCYPGSFADVVYLAVVDWNGNLWGDRVKQL